MKATPITEAKRRRAHEALDRLIVLKDRETVAEVAWQTDPWDGEEIGPAETRNMQKRERYFRAEQAVGAAARRLLAIIDCDGYTS